MHPRSDSTTRLARARRFATGAPMALLLALLYLGMAVTGQADKSATVDEGLHLAGGYSYWLTDDYRLHPENGNFPQRWAAIPLLFGNYRFPSLDQAAWHAAGAWALGDQFLHTLGNDLPSMLAQGRLMIAVLGAALGVLVYAWARSLYGPAGGMLAALLYTFCPNTLAHGSLMTSDMAVSLTLAASLWCLWVMLHRLTPLTVLGTALVMGVLFVSKMSAVLIIPMGLALLAIRLLYGKPPGPASGGGPGAGPPAAWPALAGAALAQVLIVALVIWAFYGFRYAAFNAYEPGRDQLGRGWAAVLKDSGAIGATVEFARDHRLLPEAYLFGFAAVIQNARERRAFLNGEYSMTGWWHFFPYALLVKTPIPLFLLLALAVPGLARSGRDKVGRELYRTAPLWVLLLVYWAFALTSNLNVGHRHLLPTYPVMFILAGSAAYWFHTRCRAAQALLVVALVWFAAESVTIRPHYLAYFNQLDGGPRHAYRHLVDGSLDWGQDLPGLKRWLDRHGLGGDNPTPLYLSYFGIDSGPEYYGIQASRLPVSHSPGTKMFSPLTGGVYCISATMLQAVYLQPGGRWRPLYERAYRDARADMERFHQTAGDREARAHLVEEKGAGFWTQRVKQLDQLRLGRLASYLRQREPDDHVGYSILIYRLSDAQVREALDGPPAELRPDDS